MEFSAHTTRPTFVIDMKTVSFPFLLSISLKLRNTKLLLPQITSFLQLLPLVFLVLAHNIKVCWGHHPLPATEKMIRNQMFNINKEAQKDQRLNKEGWSKLKSRSSAISQKPTLVFQLGQYWKYCFRSVLSSILCINTVLTVSRDKYRLKILEICFAYST